MTLAARFGIALLASGFLGCALLGGGSRFETVTPTPPGTGPLVDTSRIERMTLSNGAQLIVMEDHRLPRLVLGASFRRGAGRVPLAQAGLADFSAALLERGTGDRDALSLAKAVDAIGASFSVSAGWDSTHVGVSGLSRDRDALLGFLTDAILAPRFETEEARQVRKEHLAALQKRIEDPKSRASSEVGRLLYPGHRYSLPIAGIPESVGKLEAEDARRYHAEVFVPGNAILSVSGDVDAKAIRDALETRLAAWKPAAVPAEASAPPRPAPVATRIVVVDRPDLTQARVVLAQGGLARNSPERIPAILVNAVLGGSGFSSRLMTKVRSEEGLAYGVGSGFAMRRQPGPFSIATSTRVAKAGRVVELLLASLKTIRSQPPSATELALVKSFVVGRFALNLETAEDVVATLVSLAIYGLPDDSLDTYRARVSAVTPEVAAHLARSVFHPDDLAIVLVGPAEQLLPQREAFGPVEVVPNDPTR